MAPAPGPLLPPPGRPPRLSAVSIGCTGPTPPPPELRDVSPLLLLSPLRPSLLLSLSLPLPLSSLPSVSSSLDVALRDSPESLRLPPAAVFLSDSLQR